jgi:phosphoglycolate phosphatase (TIGR01487 family)
LKDKIIEKIEVFAIDIDGTLTENGNGAIYLPAVSKLRFLERLGFKVIFVTGRSSIEAFILSIFCGTTRVAVGENGGVVTTGPQDHAVLASKERCEEGYNMLKKLIPNVNIKTVFPRKSEVVLSRTFDITAAQSILDNNGLDLYLSDSKYAYHINEKGINKATGLKHALQLLKINHGKFVAIGDSETDVPLFEDSAFSVALAHSDDEVKNKANYVAAGKAGIGLSNAIDHVFEIIL